MGSGKIHQERESGVKRVGKNRNHCKTQFQIEDGELTLISSDENQYHPRSESFQVVY